jgi:hypothetical protein
MYELEADAHDRENDSDAEPHALSHRRTLRMKVAQGDKRKQTL